MGEGHSKELKEFLAETKRLGSWDRLGYIEGREMGSSKGEKSTIGGRKVCGTKNEKVLEVSKGKREGSKRVRRRICNHPGYLYCWRMVGGGGIKTDDLK